MARVSVPKKVLDLRDNISRRPTLRSFGFSLNSSCWRIRQRVTESTAQAKLENFLYRGGFDYSGVIKSPN